MTANRRRIVSMADPSERVLKRLSRNLDLLIGDTSAVVEEAVATLVELMRAGDSDSVRQKAAAKVLDVHCEAVSMRAKLDQGNPPEQQRGGVQVLVMDRVDLAIATQKARNVLERRQNPELPVATVDAEGESA